MSKQLLLSTSAVIALMSTQPVWSEINEVGTFVIRSNSDNEDGNGGLGDEPLLFREGASGDLMEISRYRGVSVTNQLTVGGATDLNSSLNVDGGATFRQDVQIINLGEDTADLEVQGQTSTGSLFVSGSSTMNGVVDINNSVDVDTSAQGSIAMTISPTNVGEDSVTSDFTMSSGVFNVYTTNDNGGASITLNPSSAENVNDQSLLLTTTASSTGLAGDIDLISADDIEITANDNIYLDAADDVEVYAVQDLEILAMRLGGETTNTDTETELTGYGGILAIQGKDTNRYIADANGKIVLLDNTDDWDGQFNAGNPMKDSAETVAAGTTAQLLVGDVQGNMRGLVVQENKTTLSGGQNAASLSLDENGATFSDPKNGRPIQVHGVADGSAPFDAVNVRQLYSGLAAVMAAGTPELRLEPGKTSAAIGVGYYGGYSGVGFGLGHMYDNGTVTTISVGKAEESEVAVKGSISWTW